MAGGRLADGGDCAEAGWLRADVANSNTARTAILDVMTERNPERGTFDALISIISADGEKLSVAKTATGLPCLHEWYHCLCESVHHTCSRSTPHFPEAEKPGFDALPNMWTE